MPTNRTEGAAEVSVEIDMNEVRTLAADVSRVPGQMRRHLVPTLKKGAVNIKKTMQRDLRRSRTYGIRYIARTITFDVHAENADSIAVEIGPDKDLDGDLANIAYFGSWKGGGEIRDPHEALKEEAPAFEKHILEAAVEVWP